MELILLLVLVAGILILWARTGELATRLDRAEGDVEALRERIRSVAGTVEAPAEHGAEAAPASGQLEVGPAAATSRRDAERRRRLAEDLAAAAEAAAKAAAIPEPGSAPASYWVQPGKAATRPAAAAEPAAEAPMWTPPAPAGPSLVQRLLANIGLTPPAEGDAISRGAIVAWLEGRMLAVVGGIALLLGAVFFLSLAFSRGWITEPMRVLIGLVAGAGLLALGELAFSKLRGIVGHVLVAVGLAIVSLALLAATRLYDLVPVEWGLAGALIAAIAAAAIAIRHDSQLVAGYGLIAVLAAPPVLGASPTLVTLLFVAVTLVGTTAVALFRTWSWLPPLAFVLAAPQLASYVTGDAPVLEALVAIAGFWLVNTIAAGGEETRHATSRLRTTTVTLLLASAAFTIWAGFSVLSGPEDVWRGSFLAALAVAHLALGLLFLARNGDRHPFGLVVSATGIAVLTMAVPVQFGGAPVPIAWAAEAVALAWVASLRRHPYSAAVSVLLGALAVGHLLSFEYPPREMASGFTRDWPFVGPEGMTFAFLIAALIVAGLAVRATWFRAALAALGGMLTLYVLPFELSGPALVTAWAAVAVLAVASYVRVVAVRIPVGFVETRLDALALPEPVRPAARLAVGVVSRAVRPSFAWLAGLAWIVPVTHLVRFDFPLATIGDRVLSSVPYGGPESISLLAVLIALAAIAWIGAARWMRLGATGIGLALLAYSVTFEIDRPHVLLAWGALAVLAVVVVRRLVRIDPLPARGLSTLVAAGERAPLGAAALAALFLVTQGLWYAGVEPFIRHVAGGLGTAGNGAPFLDVRSYAFAILAATALAAGWAWGGTIARLVGGVAAALVVAWLLPFEVRPGYAVAGWAALVLSGAWAIRVAPAGRTVVSLPAAGLAAFGALVTVAVVAPPDRLAVDADTLVQGLPILTDATVALGAMAVALAIGALLHRAEPLIRWAVLAAAVATVYLLSVGLVDVFQRAVGSRPIEELQKEAQVGLSVLWSVLGVVAFGTGLWLHRPPVRLSGLALLGLATVKVFLVDLAALDVAYRVLSLVALGVLLLVSALAYSRTQRPHPPASPKPA